MGCYKNICHALQSRSERLTITERNLGPLTGCTAGTSGFSKGKDSIYLQGAKQGAWGCLVLQGSELPVAFSESYLKGNIWGDGCSMCDSFLIGWWDNRVMFPESLSSTFWFHPPGGHMLIVTILHLGLWGSDRSSCRTTSRLSDCYEYPYSWRRK